MASFNRKQLGREVRSLLLQEEVKVAGHTGGHLHHFETLDKPWLKGYFSVSPYFGRVSGQGVMKWTMQELERAKEVIGTAELCFVKGTIKGAARINLDVVEPKVEIKLEVENGCYPQLLMNDLSIVDDRSFSRMPKRRRTADDAGQADDQLLREDIEIGGVSRGGAVPKHNTRKSAIDEVDILEKKVADMAFQLDTEKTAKERLAMELMEEKKSREEAECVRRNAVHDMKKEKRIREEAEASVQMWKLKYDYLEGRRANS